MDMLLSDFDSFSESSSYDDQDDVEYLFSGQACSILSSLEESIGKIDDFLSFERVFMYGDIVCLVKDPSSQMGRVVKVEMIVDLENISGDKMQNVNSKSLSKIHSISVGDYVVSGPWLGKVEKIVDKVTVLFDDGAKAEFTTMGSEITPISPDFVEDPQYPFYPGRRVQVQSLSASRSTKWLCGVISGRRDQGTICTVDAGFVYVDWIGCANLGYDKLPTPSNMQDSKNLTLLSCFSHAKWQLGDWCVLPVEDSENVMQETMLSSSSSGGCKSDNQLKKASQKRNRCPNVPQIAVISRTRTRVDVLWQDGSLTVGLDSESLFPVNNVDPHEFWPEQFVIENGTCDDTNLPSLQRWGVVRCVDAKERTVKVEWTTLAVNEPNNLKGDQVEEIVSSYELMNHPDYSYCLGDAVFKFRDDRSFGLVNGKSFSSHMFLKIGMNFDSNLKHIDTKKDHQDFPSNDHLSRIGIIVGFKDGNIEVKWTTGLTSVVAPFEIYRLDKCESATVTTVSHGENGDRSNVAMNFHDSRLSKHEGKDVLNFRGDGESCQENLWDSSSCSLQSAIGFFSSITSSLFGSLGTSISGIYQNISEDAQNSTISHEEVVEFCNLNTGIPPLQVGYLKTSTGIEQKQELKEIEDQKDYAIPSSSNRLEQFRQFDTVNIFSDHHFADYAGKAVQLSQVRRGWPKKVQQEWSILEHGLPETIYVRVCEERMDLLRAAIVGARGTPYHDGLFFFDICIPQDYPHEPPMVHYNSGGLRVNPNLYESGKVCLSLLNTWTGTGNEVWNPNSSTILQVLLSLQALVLNEKPYFNEAGYDAQIGKADGEKNSVSYNENAFLVTCKSMVYLLHKPPKHFEALVEEHFNKRWKSILLACKAYMEGAPVGSPFQPKTSEHEPMKGSSTGFKIMVGKLFPKLVEAFSGKGIDCTQLSYQT